MTKKTGEERMKLIMHPVNSSNIKSIGFEKGVLFTEFKNGNVFMYEGVPKKEFDSMLKAESVGKYFNANIKDKFKANVMTPGGEIELTKEGDIAEKEPAPTPEPMPEAAALANDIVERMEDASKPDPKQTADAPLSDTEGHATDTDATATSDAGDQNAVKFVVKGSAPITDEHQSDNLDKLRQSLARYEIDFQYERATDKDGAEHWNITATIGEEEQTRQITRRIDGNATDEEVAEAHDEIVKEFMKGAK